MYKYFFSEGLIDPNSERSSGSSRLRCNIDTVSEGAYRSYCPPARASINHRVPCATQCTTGASMQNQNKSITINDLN